MHAQTDIKKFVSFPKRTYRILGLFSGYRGSFPAIRRLEREADHSPPSSAEVKNVCFISLQHGLDREDFTFAIITCRKRDISAIYFFGPEFMDADVMEKNAAFVTWNFPIY